jgi:hypothetical protein
MRLAYGKKSDFNFVNLLYIKPIQDRLKEIGKFTRKKGAWRVFFISVCKICLADFIK